MVQTAFVFKGWTALSLLLRGCEVFLLLLLPATAACLAAIRRGWRDVCLLICLGLAAVGAAGYLAFWLWFLSPVVGRVFSLLTPFACAGYAWFAWRKMGAAQSGVLKPLALPVALVLAATMLTVAAGYLYGGTQTPLYTPQIRFSHRLPGDNEVPWFFVQQLRKGHISKPMFLDWLSSDRPPLQTGLTLLELPFLPGPRPLSYQISGVLLQCLWIPALWLFLLTRNTGRSAAALSLAAVAFSGFALLNSFFVWPKLLAAAYLMAASAMLLSKRLLVEMKRQPAVALLAGVLLGLGLLSHGGVVFSFLGLVPVMLMLRVPIRARAAALVLLGCVAFYLPWMLYQKLFDPPADRLLKWHLAGVQDLDARPFGQTLRESYHALSWHQILDARKENALMILDSQRAFWSNLKDFSARLPHDLITGSLSAAPFANELKVLQFFQLSATLGLLMPGVFFLAAGVVPQYRSDVWRAATVCFIFAISTLIIWCALMFLPMSTVIHLGSYASVVFALAGSVLAIYAVSRTLAASAVFLNSVLTVIVYVFYSRPAATDPKFPAVFDGAEMLMLIVAAAIFLTLLARMTRSEPERTGAVLMHIGAAKKSRP